MPPIGVPKYELIDALGADRRLNHWQLVGRHALDRDAGLDHAVVAGDGDTGGQRDLHAGEARVGDGLRLRRVVDRRELVVRRWCSNRPLGQLHDGVGWLGVGVGPDRIQRVDRCAVEPQRDAAGRQAG